MYGLHRKQVLTGLREGGGGVPKRRSLNRSMCSDPSPFRGERGRETGLKTLPSRTPKRIVKINEWFDESLRFMSPKEKCHDQGMWKPNFRTIPAISKQSYNLLFGLITVEHIQRCLIFGHASLVVVCKRSVRCCSAHLVNFTVCSNSWIGITKIWTMNRF